MTEVKIEAHGHLGNFSREYFIVEGQEEKMLRIIARDLTTYVLKGVRNRVLSVFYDLAKLEKEYGNKEREKRRSNEQKKDSRTTEV